MAILFRSRKRSPVFKTKKDPSLGKIIIGIMVAVIVLVAAARFYHWYMEEYVGKGIEAESGVNLAKARECIAQGETAEAKALLEPIAARAKEGSVVVNALMLLAQIESDAGETEAALSLLKRANEEFPDCAEQPRAAIAYAALLEDAGRPDDAASVYEQVRAQAPPTLRAPALIGLGRKAEGRGELVEARDLYRQAVAEAEWDSEACNEALDGLGSVSVAMIFSPAHLAESKVYVVEKGDNLINIGVNLNTTQGMLMRANDIEDPTKLWPGQRLKYTPKDFQIIVERSTCRLFLLDNEGLVKRYHAGLGKEGHVSALGVYKIGHKEKDPVWHKRGEGPIPAGDPRNELGTRWMPLVPVEEDLPQDLGIHGTIKPETVGTYASMGCIRLLREDIEELYDLVVRSTPVQIVEVFTPENG